MLCHKSRWEPVESPRAHGWDTAGYPSRWVSEGARPWNPEPPGPVWVPVPPRDQAEAPEPRAWHQALLDWEHSPKGQGLSPEPRRERAEPSPGRDSPRRLLQPPYDGDAACTPSDVDRKMGQHGPQSRPDASPEPRQLGV